MKNPRIAAGLSFVLPGSGLWYTGHPGWGMLNFGVAVVLPIALVFLAPEFVSQYVLYVILVIAAASAGLAHAVATQTGPTPGEDGRQSSSSRVTGS